MPPFAAVLLVTLCGAQDGDALGALPPGWEVFQFGSSGGPAGDWNADGVGDCFVAAPFGRKPTPPPEGTGGTGGFLFVFDGARIGHLLGVLGTSSSSADDLCALRGEDGTGVSAVAVYGGGEVLEFEPGSAAARTFRPGVGSGGGLDLIARDGRRLLAIGGLRNPAEQEFNGSVSLHDIDVRPTLQLWRTPSPQSGLPSGAWTGSALALLEHPGSDEPLVVATSAPGSHRPEDGPGAVFLLAGTDGRVLATVHGSLPGDRYGYDLTVVGDLDGDGVRDLAVGAPGCRGTDTCRLAREEPLRPGCDFPGFVDVLSGRDLRRLRRIAPPERASRFGSALLWLPDRAPDAAPGAGLLVVTAPGDCFGTGTFDLGFEGVAAAYELAREEPAWIYRDTAYDHFGLSLFEGCDWDRDGTPEVCSGRGSPDAGAFAPGEVCVLSGRTGEPLATLCIAK